MKELENDIFKTPLHLYKDNNFNKGCSSSNNSRQTINVEVEDKGTDTSDLHLFLVSYPENFDSLESLGRKISETKQQLRILTEKYQILQKKREESENEENFVKSLSYSKIAKRKARN